MSLGESLLIVVGLSLNVFLIAEYEGSMLRSIHIKKLLCMCGIFFLLQIAAMMGGYAVTLVPFFQETSSTELKKMCRGMAMILFLILALVMIYKAWKKEIILERLSEIRFKRIFLEALVIAFFTFLAGIGCGFLVIGMESVCFITGCATILAVLAGISTGYHQGYRFRSGIYGTGGVLFLIAGFDVMFRYL